jgi:N-acetylmuramoyl-L-alanine amidase
VTIHNTGNASKGAGAKSHAAYVKGDAAANLPVSWHYTVDEKDIYQHLPDSEDAFHAGDGAGDGNRKSIGIEICMNSDGDLLKATDKAAELTAFLCGKYNIPVENVVQHQKWSGKNCPQLIRNGKPYNWNAFLSKVRSFMGANLVAPAPAQTVTPAAPPATTPAAAIKKGDTVKLTENATYYDGKAIPDWVKKQNWIVSSVNGDRAVIDKNVAGTNSINSPVNIVNIKSLTVVAGASAVNDNPYVTYIVRAGETLWSIAAAKLGNGARYTEIKALNRLTTDVIIPGQVLKIPEN